MIDLEGIKTHLVSLAQESVGEYLSLTGDDTYSEPSVIIARPNITVPAFPYIVLDSIDLRETYGTTPRERLVDNQLQYELNYTIQFQFVIKGTDSRTGIKALQIAQALRSYITIPSIQDRLFCETCAEFQEVFPVLDASDQVAAQDYVEAAYFSFTVAIWDVFTSNRTEDTSGVFDTISLEGSLKRQSDDINPLPFRVNVP